MFNYNNEDFIMFMCILFFIPFVNIYHLIQVIENALSL